MKRTMVEKKERIDIFWTRMFDVTNKEILGPTKDKTRFVISNLEDKKWIEDNTNPQKFKVEETNPLHAISQTFKSLTFENRDKTDIPNRPSDDENLVEIITEMQELAQLDRENAKLFANLGCLKPLIELMIYPEPARNEVRKTSCRLFNTLVSGDRQMQTFASKYGAGNLAIQIERENEPEMREWITSSVNAFLEADFYPGKEIAEHL